MNNGPGWKSNEPVPCEYTLTPVRSLGSRSGVNWMRRDEPPMTWPNARAGVVLPTPGTSQQQMPSRDQRHYRELNHLAGARQHTGKRVDDVADDRRRHGGSVDRDVFVSSAVAFDTRCAYYPSRPRRQPPSARCGYCAASHTARDSSVIWLGATAEEMSLLITASTYGWVPNTIATSF